MRVIDSGNAYVVAHIYIIFRSAARNVRRRYVPCLVVGRRCLRVAACLAHPGAAFCTDKWHRKHAYGRVGFDLPGLDKS